MPHYIDLVTWPRRQVFEFYLPFDKPYFNVCTRLDVTKLLTELKKRERASVALTYHYFALRAANEIEPFRYRLRQGQVLVHDVINGGTTFMLPNETFTLVYFDYNENYAEFIKGATRAMEEIRTGDGAFRPRHEDDARLHCTTLPWIAFTSFSHARRWGPSPRSGNVRRATASACGTPRRAVIASACSSRSGPFRIRPRPRERRCKEPAW